MATRTAILYVLLCVSSFCLCAQLTSVRTQTRVPQLKFKLDIDHLTHGDAKQQKAALFKLHEAGIDVLPLLIESIDDTAPFSQVRLENPILSYIPPEALKQSYAGVLVAYTVELILGTEALRGNPSDSRFLADREDCVYSYGLLQKKDGSIRQNDLREIKKIYKRWWKAHEGMTLEQLRQEWSKNKRPLTGSPYNWK